MSMLLYFLKAHRGGKSMNAAEEENRYGEELRDARLKRGLTVRKLSQVSGVSRRWISNAEKGLNISVDVLKRLTAALGIAEIVICERLSVKSGAPAGIDHRILRIVAEKVQ